MVKIPPPERQKMRQSATEAYRRFNRRVLLGVANSGIGRAEKIGDGKLRDAREATRERYPGHRQWRTLAKRSCYGGPWSYCLSREVVRFPSSPTTPWTEHSELHEIALDSCLASSTALARQSGWKLKFPPTLLTVPDMGRLQWSQIIRISFSLPWTRRSNGARIGPNRPGFTPCLLSKFAVLHQHV